MNILIRRRQKHLEGGVEKFSLFMVRSLEVETDPTTNWESSSQSESCEGDVESMFRRR